MNPFELPGPEFLVFYVFLCVLVLGGAGLARHVFESGQVPQIWQPDPYWFAHLRADAEETIRVATLSLHDRGLLIADGETLRSAPGASWYARRPLEQSIIGHFEQPGSASSAQKSYACRLACSAIEAELREQGLLPSAGQKWVRLLLGLGATAFLWAWRSSRCTSRCLADATTWGSWWCSRSWSRSPPRSCSPAGGPRSGAAWFRTSSRCSAGFASEPRPSSWAARPTSCRSCSVSTASRR